MRICHVLHTLNVGGAEVLVAQIARALRRREGFEATVALLDDVGVLGEELRGEGFDIHCVDRRPGIDLGAVGRLRRYLAATRPDVVHTHQYGPYFYGGTAAARQGIPLVFTEHGRHQPDRPRLRRVLYNRWLLRHTSAITAVSRSIRQALVQNERMPAGRIEVLYNGVDHERLRADAERRREVRRALELDDGTVAIGTAGRLVGVKNQALLLRSLARLATAFPGPLRAFLAGSGPLDGELRQQARSLGIQDWVRFLGERDDVPDLLKAWDIFTLPSFSEGTSVTLLEAMSSGLPVVATRVGGNGELVEDGVQGRLVPSDDEEAFSAALAELCADAERRARLGAAARREVEQRFAFTGMLDRFCSIYREVAGDQEESV